MKAQYFEDLQRRYKVFKKEKTRRGLQIECRSLRNSTLEKRLVKNCQLMKMSPNQSLIRIRNRCIITGRARGMYSNFKLSRNQLRDHGLKGCVAGVTKSSW